ncbi:MAG: hypothetical protein WA184_00275 [Stellaceae bacterium]
MKDIPDFSPRKQAERAARERRLGEALRSNLRRRKEQARAQAGRGSGLSGEPLCGTSNGHGDTTAD